MKTFITVGILLATLAVHAADLTNAAPAATDVSARGSRLLRPLSLAEALDLALQQNGSVRKSQAQLEATYGVSVQTRAIALPKLGVNGSYGANQESSIDRFRSTAGNSTNSFLTDAFDYSNQRWNADVRLTQSIYEGGRINASLRAARLSREQALLNHQSVLSDVMRDVRVAYYDALLAQQLISVEEASVKLLQQELDETMRRFEAGTVPRFNVLRAEVAVANERPLLIRARNAFSVAKDTIAFLVGEREPHTTSELPLILTDRLEAPRMELPLTNALALALENRTELAALRKGEALQVENIASAKSGARPSVQLFAGYGSKSSQFNSDLLEELHGWEVGAQLSWSLFDGFLTKGRVQEAVALRTKAQEELFEAMRRVELDVRAAHSSFIEAREVLISQDKVQESAEESLRLATARSAAGSATQLDVLNAQTALTQARSTQARALRDYAVAHTRLERAIGPVVSRATNAPAGK